MLDTAAIPEALAYSPALPKREQLCNVDRKTRIVMRRRRAVALGWMQFALFDALHRARRNKVFCVTSKELWDTMYQGCRPAGYNSIPQIARQANDKLAHLGIKIQGVNRREHSFYRLILV